MLSISLDKQAYNPGDTIKVEIKLNLNEPLQARGVSLALSCEQQEMLQKTRIIDHYEFFRRKQLGIPPAGDTERCSEHICKEISREEKHVGTPGWYSSRSLFAEFTLPSNANPSSYDYGHDSKIFVWKLSAKLDVPNNLDQHDEKEIQVLGLGKG